MLSRNPRSVNFHSESFYFYLSGTIKDEVFEPTVLSIVIPDIKSSQTIDLSNHNLSWTKMFDYGFVSLIDMNLDGHKDLLFLSAFGNWIGMENYDIWLFDSVNNRFLYNEDYSYLSSPSITRDKKSIKSYWRGGYCDEIIEYYKPNGLLSPILFSKIYAENVAISGTITCWKIFTKIVDGKWIEMKRDTLKDRLYYEEFLNK
jgi:hypothetical protein